ncbi:phosphatidylinositol N-acetylglucosaminyltransferase subunit P-like [Cornus florida]|uniref:phosphatidylinositol N-acetylglucosaminyltransferase subunit P-like n=1 Tax=Cornus florida TaxID=4283 RepID=UPI00289E5128|nr:phosphatidylinositol N-acetylglucosaminyltransferase subunit P-like [Cornus florida]XP_059651698.1 phosphatidylinositol N-acetylglucosaminyltransferase subunit P-like [Cornus florida]
MEDPRSVNSPRRILSFNRNKRATVSFPDPDNRASGVGISAYGPKPSEVYGFVGSISTVVSTVLFLVWAYVPERWLHSIGLFYYPSRYWALAVPTYAMVTVVLAIGFYIGLNFMATPPPTSFNTMFDEFSREPLGFVPSAEGSEQPIEPISDISINQINDLMFNDLK